MKRSTTHKGAFFKLIALIIGILLLVAMVSWVMAWAFNSFNDQTADGDVSANAAIQAGMTQVTDAENEALQSYDALHENQQLAVDEATASVPAQYDNARDAAGL